MYRYYDHNFKTLQAFYDEIVERKRHYGVINWQEICENNKISPAFLSKFKDIADWDVVSSEAYLSPAVIWKFRDYLDWENVVQSQHLPCFLLRKTYGYWERRSYYLPEYQVLDEDFILDFWDRISHYYILTHQRLSKKLVRKFWHEYSREMLDYQDIPKDLLGKININNYGGWRYRDDAWKLKFLRRIKKFEISKDEKSIIAYKSVRENFYSVATFRYKYEIGKTYESNCDCNSGIGNSFGLAAWTSERALRYWSQGRLLKVKIAIKDIGCITREGKIRCWKMKILKDVTAVS